jgi:glycosyltransferase involved in cell wall biosynthesis
MKIVHIVEPLAGGIVTFLKSLVENLPDDFHIIVHGERKQVMPFSEVKKEFAYPNVKFLRWKSAQRSLRLKEDISATVELYSILKRLKKSGSFDVVHLHSSKGGFIGRIVCRMLGIQHLVVYTPNGAPFLGSASNVSNFMYKRLEKLASTFGGQVVCCSFSEQKAYESAGINALMINNGTPGGKIVGSLNKPQKNRLFRIVTSGRIVNQKNPVLFNKIATYFQEFKQFEFIWAGDGTDRHLLTATNIHVTGWLGKSDLDSIVSNADMYLSTATFEGLPFSVLEALALKKPVLLTDCVGNKDLVMEGLNGGTFQHENEAINKILQFYNNSSMLRVMGEHSATYCKNAFDYTDTCKRYRKLYHKAAYKQSASTINLNQLAHGNR